MVRRRLVGFSVGAFPATTAAVLCAEDEVGGRAGAAAGTAAGAATGTAAGGLLAAERELRALRGLYGLDIFDGATVTAAA